MATLQMVFITPVAYVIARPQLSWELVGSLTPLAVVNVLNVVCGLVGTEGLNLPMFIALRRFTLLFTILLERFWLRKTHDWPTIGAMTLMIGGALLAALTDLTFSLRGYLAVLTNDALTSLYLIMVKNSPATAGLSTTGMLFYNSALSLPMLGAALLLRSEPAAVARYPLLWAPRFQIILFLASALGLSINHSTFVCTRVNEPLMTSVAGNLKNIIMTVVGALMFGDFVFRFGNAAGLALSMAGAIWYATRSAFKVGRVGGEGEEETLRPQGSLLLCAGVCDPALGLVSCGTRGHAEHGTLHAAGGLHGLRVCRPGRSCHPDHSRLAPPCTTGAATQHQGQPAAAAAGHRTGPSEGAVFALLQRHDAPPWPNWQRGWRGQRLGHRAGRCCDPDGDGQHRAACSHHAIAGQRGGRGA